MSIPVGGQKVKMIKNADTTICIVNQFTFGFWVNYGLINKQLCVLLTGRGSEAPRNLYLPAFHNNDICVMDALAASFDSTTVVHWHKKNSNYLFYLDLNDLFHCLMPEAIVRGDLSSFLMPTKLKLCKCE